MLIAQRRMPTIAGEEIIASCTREQHRAAVLAREAADVEHIQRGGVCQGLVQLDDHARKIVSHPVGIDSHYVERHLQVVCYTTRIGQVIRCSGFLPETITPG